MAGPRPDPLHGACPALQYLGCVLPNDPLCELQEVQASMPTRLLLSDPHPHQSERLLLARSGCSLTSRLLAPLLSGAEPAGQTLGQAGRGVTVLRSGSPPEAWPQLRHLYIRATCSHQLSRSGWEEWSPGPPGACSSVHPLPSLLYAEGPGWEAVLEGTQDPGPAPSLGFLPKWCHGPFKSPACSPRLVSSERAVRGQAKGVSGRGTWQGPHIAVSGWFPEQFLPRRLVPMGAEEEGREETGRGGGPGPTQEASLVAWEWPQDLRHQQVWEEGCALLPQT